VVFAVKPVILLVKFPVPAPSIVLLLAVVGLAETLQQTPLEVTSAPPSFVTLPPDKAVVELTPVMDAVVITGIVFLLQVIIPSTKINRRITVIGVLNK
jgi:hypothetical protein